MINYIKDLYTATKSSCKMIPIYFSELRYIRKMGKNILTDYTVFKQDESIKKIREEAVNNYNPKNDVKPESDVESEAYSYFVYPGKPVIKTPKNGNE